MTEKEYQMLNDYEFFVLTHLQYKSAKRRKGAFRTYPEVPLQEVMIATRDKHYQERYKATKNNQIKLEDKAREVEEILKGRL